MPTAPGGTGTTTSEFKVLIATCVLAIINPIMKSKLNVEISQEQMLGIITLAATYIGARTWVKGKAPNGGTSIPADVHADLKAAAAITDPAAQAVALANAAKKL